MKIILGLIFLYLVLPIIGQWVLLDFYNDNYFVTASWSLFWNNIVFVTLIFCFLLPLFKYSSVHCVDIVKPNKLLFRCLCVSVLVIAFVFYVAGYDFLFKGAYRGDIRVSLGFLGPIYAWVTTYLSPLLLAIAYLSINSKNFNRKKMWQFYLVFLLILLSAIFTGYKSRVVVNLFPLITLFFLDKKANLKLILLAGISFVLLVFATTLVRDADFASAYQFILYRMSILMSAGTVGVGQEFPNGAPFDDSILLALGSLGNKLAPVVLGVDFSDMLAVKTNLSRYITYLVYADTEGALAGTVNLTVTSYGEAIYIFGMKWYFIYAIFSAFFIRYVVMKFIKNISVNPVRGLMYLIYFYSVVLVWLNSGGIWNLLGPTVIIYMLMSYLFLIVILKGKFN